MPYIGGKCCVVLQRFLLLPFWMKRPKTTVYIYIYLVRGNKTIMQTVFFFQPLFFLSRPSFRSIYVFNPAGMRISLLPAFFSLLHPSVSPLFSSFFYEPCHKNLWPFTGAAIYTLFIRTRIVFSLSPLFLGQENETDKIGKKCVVVYSVRGEIGERRVGREEDYMPLEDWGREKKNKNLVTAGRFQPERTNRSTRAWGLHPLFS